MNKPVVTVVGLGPGGPDLMTAGTVEAIGSARVVFARTERHPGAAVLGDATFFDDVYETSDTMDEVYATIVESLVEAAWLGFEDGRGSRVPDVVYAVPGSPLVAERTVQLLLADDRVEVETMAALSFLDLAWVRLGLDPIEAGVRVIDGHSFASEVAGQPGPFLVAQCDSALILSDIKLSVEDWPADPVTVIQRLGLPDERIFEVDWPELDREVDPDHLTAIYIPSIGAPVAADLVRFDELVHTLRAGCPWDRDQTHASLKRYLLEECYELLEAIDGIDEENPTGVDNLCEELGDVLFQVFFHATIAAEAGWFTLADVASGVTDKLRSRHPHVFGSARFDSADELSANWEAHKVIEKSRGSIMDGIPAALPALLYALKVQKKAATVGFVEPLGEVADDLVKVLADGGAGNELGPAAIGDLLFDLVELSRRSGVDPEDELRRAAGRFRGRFEAHSAI